ncbi:38k [Hemileuca sp. nucleopolyhedrovirus]|uniref:38k n=1 Tax=Hemileuca sp. nucleopolyhedrovirus TaxID=1367203 RepID=S5MQ89_9ABAC|nr:38k [Hemileuca sp. nucleopolyhedrovirus]AGR56838.1 38k [Hemileuca sp. nucleopolyhedrovirus]
MQCSTWTVLRRKRPFIKRHLLVVDRYRDLRRLMFGHLEFFEFVLFAFDKHTNLAVDLDTYMIRIIKCPDEMNEIRYNLKLAYKTSALGHTYIINECVPMYGFLNEWYIQNYLEIYQLRQETYVWEAPHVIVFDLDSTLITDELDVRIRDENVYCSLYELKEKGCVLVLWSYGNEEHVSHSLKKTNLTDFFDIVICKGYKTISDNDNDDDTQTNVSTGRVVVDKKNDTVYVDKQFYLDIEDGDRLPKSPRIVLWHLRKIGVNYIKSLTLVDDLRSNNYSYDFFVNVKKCPQPRQDWYLYHDLILENLQTHDRDFESAQ